MDASRPESCHKDLNSVWPTLHQAMPTHKGIPSACSFTDNISNGFSHDFTLWWPNFFPKSCNNTGIPPAPRNLPAFEDLGVGSSSLVSCLVASFRAPHSSCEASDALQAAMQPPALQTAGFTCQPQYCVANISSWLLSSVFGISTECLYLFHSAIYNFTIHL